MPLMPPLQTERLIIRPFTIHDLDDIHQLLDIDLTTAYFGTEGATSRDERHKWLEWTVMNYEELAKLYQPPYVDRAVTLKQSGQLIGACGYVPSFGPFEQLPSFHPPSDTASKRLYTPE